MPVTIRMLDATDTALLLAADAALFDHPVRAELVGAFFASEHHHLAGAIEDDALVSFVSAVTYLHPDKPLHMWINEVSTLPACRGRGLAGAVCRAMIDHGHQIGCHEIWLATEDDNAAARAVYRKISLRETTGIVMYDVPPRDVHGRHHDVTD